MEDQRTQNYLYSERSIVHVCMYWCTQVQDDWHAGFIVAQVGVCACVFVCKHTQYNLGQLPSWRDSDGHVRPV